MFASLQLYRVNPIFEQDFITSWTALVDQLKQAGYLQQATLHKESRISYIAYFGWAGREAYDRFTHHLEPALLAIRDRVCDYCNHVQELHRMSVITSVAKAKHRETE